MLVRRVWPSRPTFESSLTDFDQLRHEMLRLFEAASGEQHAGQGAGVFPPINVTEDRESYHVRAELPGVHPNELAISALRNRLVLSGERRIAPEHEHASYHRKERPEGSFSRSLTLPGEVDAERVEARYADGILSIRLPKAEAAKPRQIKVKT